MTAKVLNSTVIVHPVSFFFDFHLQRFYLKPSFAPFSLADEFKFSWLQNAFLHYFEKWGIQKGKALEKF